MLCLAMNFVTPNRLSFSVLYIRHRHLHTFPTRRSSDLVGVADLGQGIYRSQDGGATWHPLPGQPVSPAFMPHHAVLASTRSEEHTSELQSPCNLVCSLLLEKKKIKTNRK